MKYEPSLDGLRGLAVIAVVAFHAFGEKLPGGWMGVDVFFVLSGFLITRVLAAELRDEGAIDFKAFYLNRFYRLAPAFALLIAFNFLWAVIDQEQRSAILSAAAYSTFYLMNWARAFDWSPPGLLGHTWSLSVEEQFYLLWPLLFTVLFTRRPIKWLCVLFVSVVSWRIYLRLSGTPTGRIYNGFDTHSDGLILGCMIALVPFKEPVLRLMAKLSWLPVLGLAAVAAFLTTNWPGVFLIVGLTIVPVLAAWTTLAALQEGWLKRALSVGPLCYTGRISYGWYLWHLPLLDVATRTFGPRTTVVLSYLVAAASFHLVEAPIRDWARSRRKVRLANA